MQRIQKLNRQGRGEEGEEEDEEEGEEEGVGEGEGESFLAVWGLSSYMSSCLYSCETCIIALKTPNLWIQLYQVVALPVLIYPNFVENKYKMFFIFVSTFFMILMFTLRNFSKYRM